MIEPSEKEKKEAAEREKLLKAEEQMKARLAEEEAKKKVDRKGSMKSSLISATSDGELAEGTASNED